MADQTGTDVRLRAAFILSAVVILVVLALLAAAFPALFQPPMLAMPAVLLVALGALLWTERKSRRVSESVH